MQTTYCGVSRSEDSLGMRSETRTKYIHTVHAYGERINKKKKRAKMRRVYPYIGTPYLHHHCSYTPLFDLDNCFLCNFTCIRHTQRIHYIHPINSSFVFVLQSRFVFRGLFIRPRVRAATADARRTRTIPHFTFYFGESPTTTTRCRIPRFHEFGRFFFDFFTIVFIEHAYIQHRYLHFYCFFSTRSVTRGRAF